MVRAGANVTRGRVVGAALVALASTIGVDGLETGRRGGRLVTTLRAEPRTFNPLVAADAPSKDVIWRAHADLIHINRATQRTEPALATSWQRSPDGRRFTVELRRDVRFSDGDPFDADDVVFSLAAYVDERVASPQRDLLVVAGQPISVRKVGPYTVEFVMAAPYAAAERLFDSIAMLPRHRLEAALQDGRLGRLWGVDTAPTDIVGLGPFRFKEIRPGDRVVLERNPHYWKADTAGTALPYLDELTWLVLPSEEAQVVRFQSGEIDLLNGLATPYVQTLSRGARPSADVVRDAGPGLEYTFLFFNLAADAGRNGLFQDVRFRQAVSAVLDRAAVARLVYGGRATPLWGHVPPGNRLWIDAELPKPARSPDRARELLRSIGCRWDPDGALRDSAGAQVSFSILVAAGNSALTETAALLQADLQGIGIRVQIASLEFRAMLDRILKTRDYDAAILRLASGDADPNGEMNVWPSTGATHVWNPGRDTPATPWEAEIDRLMAQQMTLLDAGARRRAYDRVQRLVAARHDSTMGHWSADVSRGTNLYGPRWSTGTRGSSSPFRSSTA